MLRQLFAILSQANDVEFLRWMTRPILRTNFVWRLTGISYATAVVATRGRYRKLEDYIHDSRGRMQAFSGYLSGKKVVEFGCGMGGNLISISPIIRFGVGIDINKRYVRLANRLRMARGITNLSFFTYDGEHVPIPRSFAPDVVFEIGVFERISKGKVIDYVKQLRMILEDNGVMILFFLVEHAKDLEFVTKLGERAYVYWTSHELEIIFEGMGLSILEVRDWGFAKVYVLRKSRASLSFAEIMA